VHGLFLSVYRGSDGWYDREPVQSLAGWEDYRFRKEAGRGPTGSALYSVSDRLCEVVDKFLAWHDARRKAEEEIARAKASRTG
jgi:hypothetical protein